MENSDLTISVEDAARVLSIGRGLAYRLAREGTLPGVLTLGGRYVVSKGALLAALQTPLTGTTGETRAAPDRGTDPR